MNESQPGKVYYVCFYSEAEIEDKIVTYPSVISKIDYIVDTIKRLGKEVVILSIAPSKYGFFSGYRKTIDPLETHLYLPSRTHNNKYLKKLCFVRNNISLLVFLFKNVEKDDIVIVYHSLYNRFWLNVYRHVVSNRLVLQIEDVFSELAPETNKYKKIEWNLLKKMQKCICVNDIVYRDLSGAAKKAISYGSYLLPPKYDISPHESTRLVYAGVIEQERNAAFLAVKAMLFLPHNYELHILGFGSEENIDALESLIFESNLALGRTAITYHGKMTGETYWKFLQGCDIALSTHAYDASTLSSADYTFPSKILTYLANNLHVVAQRLEVLQFSKVAEYISFYDNPEPELIAKAIMQVDVEDDYDGRKVIEGLDREFINNLKSVLE